MVHVRKEQVIWGRLLFTDSLKLFLPSHFIQIITSQNSFMKSLFYTVLFYLLFSSTTSFSQGSPFNSLSTIVQAGIGLGDPDTYVANGATPFIGAALDKGIMDDLGFGNLGVGGIVGVKHFWDDQINGNWQRFLLAGRVTYHFHFVNSYNLDFYIGGMAGIYVWGRKAEVIGENNQATASYGAFAGVRYFLNNSFGVYAEAGYGLGFLNAGVAYSF
jgi:hypothetical protein